MRCMWRSYACAVLLLAAGPAGAFDQSDIDAAAPGDTLVVDCAGSPHVQSGDLLVDKTLTIVGEEGCATPTGMPTIEFQDECHEVQVLADDVVLEKLRLFKTTTSSCASQGWDSYMVQMPSIWMQPVSQVPHGGLSVLDCVFEGSRRAMRINSNGDVTIRGNRFSGNARDILFLSNLRGGGTVAIERNTFEGWGKKAVIVESGPNVDRVTGAIEIVDNVADGLGAGSNFFVYNHWEGSPAETADYPVSLTIRGNDVRNLTSNAMVVFYPVDFARFTQLVVERNLIWGAGRGVIVDYSYGGDSVAADGQYVVGSNVFCDVDRGKSGVFIEVGSQNNAIGYKEPAPSGASLDMFGPGPPASVTAAANIDGEAPGFSCELPRDCLEITGVPDVDNACCVVLDENGQPVYVGSATSPPTHGSYLACVTSVTNDLRRDDLIEPPTGREVIRDAAQSGVNKP